MCISVPLSIFRKCTQLPNLNIVFQVMGNDTNAEALGVKTRYLGLLGAVTPWPERRSAAHLMPDVIIPVFDEVTLLTPLKGKSPKRWHDLSESLMHTWPRFVSDLPEYAENLSSPLILLIILHLVLIVVKLKP